MDQVAWRDLSLGERLAGVLRRSHCRTVGQLLRRGADWRLGRAGYGSNSESEFLQAVSRLRQEFDAGLDQLLRELCEDVGERPEEACRKILVRRREGGRWMRLLGHLAHKALECVDLTVLRRHLLSLVDIDPVEDAAAAGLSPAQGEQSAREEQDGPPQPTPFFAPRSALRVHSTAKIMPMEESLPLLKGYQGMAEDKRRLLEACPSHDWPALEIELYRIADGVLPARHWRPPVALRVVPSWVLCRRLVEAVAPLTLVRRARRCRWKTVAEALAEPARDLQPGFDEVGEELLWEQIRRLTEMGPGWPVSTGDLLEEKTLQEAFWASLERLPARTARLMRLRLGAGRPKALTLQATGDRMNLSAERVRQIENAAWKTLRQDESWPRSLARKAEQALESGGTAVAVAVLAEDPWIGPELTRCRPFFDQLIRKVLGSRRRLIMRY
ncbi:MAG TPA: sigma factor-like helix-turn-helix DNA-binding protein [Acidobacteriota bacterium]|nr:sigma factor-like helix-turn-helix DNA-binding protein [Acidobacteriota bacterium]